MRAYVEPGSWTQDEIVLSEDESHHLIHVLRRQRGDLIELFNGTGDFAEASIASIARGSVTARVTQRRHVERRTPLITLIQALPREQKLDFILQKATELGLAHLIPVVTENAIVKIKADRAEDKKARWEKIVLNAAKQCGAAWLPRIEPARSLDALLQQRPALDLLIVCALTPSARAMKEVLRAAKPAPASIGILVGPEGDFSPAEMDAILAAGAMPVSLGSTVLRSETAAMYALSALRYEFDL